MNIHYLGLLNIIELLLLFMISRLMNILEAIHNSKY